MNSVMCATWESDSEYSKAGDHSEMELFSDHEGVAKYLRLKTDEEMRMQSPTMRRLKRRKKATGSNGGGAYKELPFWNLQHRKLVQLELNLDEIKYDVGVLSGRVHEKKMNKRVRRK